MRDVHRIQLRGPWQWLADDPRLGCQRRFHAPTGLEDGELVVLVIRPPAPGGELMLNGTSLGRIDQSEQRFEVTEHLSSSNLLVYRAAAAAEVDSLGPAPDHGDSSHPREIVGQVWLEIGFP